MRRIRSAVALAVLVATVMPAVARADNTAAIKIGVDPPARVDQGTWDVGSAQATFEIQVDFSKATGAQTVRCKFDDAPEGPCTQQQPTCPVTQCWTAVPPNPQSGTGHQLSVLVYDADGNLVDGAGLAYDIDTTPPDTAFSNQDTGSPIASLGDHGAVAIDFYAVEDVDYADTYQCSITAPSATAPGMWSACQPSKNLKAKFKLSGRYRIWVRAIDFLGRIDPTPATYVFSPTPCTVRPVRRPATLRAIVKHGLRLRVACEVHQPVVLQLLLSRGTVDRFGLPSQLLGQVSADPRPGRPVVVTLRTLRGVPSVLFRQRRLFVGLVSEVALGPPPRLIELALHG